MRGSTNVGFVGGGQLAKMTAQEALYMKEESLGAVNFSINILDPTPNCPAHNYATHHVIGEFKSPNAIRKLADLSDIITYDIELGKADALIELRDKGVGIYPSPETLEIIQDKYIQKDFLRSKGIPVPNFVEIDSLKELRKYARDFGYPSMLKARRDTYDGRGNFLIEKEDQLETAYNTFKDRSLMLEEFVEWEKEVSVIAARSASSELAIYPVGENIHEDSILKMTIMPARISAETSREAENIASRVMDAFGDRGVFGIEMFAYDGKILVNEVAPRVHNTGHGTFEKHAFYTSQFEQHLRSISGMPLGSTRIKKPVVMHNILGEKNGFSGPYKILGEEEVSLIPGAHLHLYGKEEVRPKRKIGHVSVVGSVNVYDYDDDTMNIIFEENEDVSFDVRSLDTVIKRTEFARKLLKIVPDQNGR